MPGTRGPQRYWRRFGGLWLAVVAGVALAWAAIPDTPDGRQVMMRMADYLSKASALSVTLHTAYDAVQQDGSKIEWNETRAVTLSRPDRLRVDSERSDGSRSLVVFNGKEVTVFDEQARVYAQSSHPGTVDEAVVHFVRDLKMRLPLAILLLQRLPAELQQRVESVEYVESSVTLGAPALHIAGKTATVDFQLWIAEGDRPLPLHAVLTYKDAPGQPQFRAQFSDWQIDVKPPDSLFTFTPPSGVNKIPFAATLPQLSSVGQQPAASPGGKQ
jgi:hypothetical protein